MSPKLNCPVCGSNVPAAGLQVNHPFRRYRVCSDCQSKYTTDAGTRKRAVLIAILALVTAAISTAGLLAGYPWGLFGALSGIGLLVYTGYTLSRIRLVEYRGSRDS